MFVFTNLPQYNQLLIHEFLARPNEECAERNQSHDQCPEVVLKDSFSKVDVEVRDRNCKQNTE